MTCTGKVRLVGDTTAVGVTPVPVRETVCGLLGALSEIFRVALRFPVAKGVNVIEIVQLPPAGTEVPQVFVCAKSVLFGPVMLSDVMDIAMLPVFDKVIFTGELVRSTVCSPKFA